MSNILLAYNNRADAATYSGGAWVASGDVALANLGTKDIGELARSSSAATTSTRFRFDLGASRNLRTLSLINHNLSTAALVRLRTNLAVFDVDWASYTAEDRATFSGGAGGTRVTSAGLVAAATTPRISYTPATLVALGLLTEQQLTNLLTYSEQFDNAAWIKTQSTVTANGATAPDGSVAMDKLVENSATASHFTHQTRTGLNETVTFSVFGKAAERTRFKLEMSNFSSASCGAYFDLSTGTVVATDAANADYTAPSAKIESFGGGIYRCSVTVTKGSVNTTNNAVVILVNTGTNTSYTGNGSSGLFIWGADLQASAFPTSYIPTVASQVTRTADSTAVTSSNFTGIHSATAGTLYAEFNLLAATGTQPIVSLDDNTANERIELYVTGTTLKFRVIDGGATQCDITIGTVAANTFYKAAVAWAANDFAGCLSGGTVQTDTAGTLPTVDRMRIGSDQAGNYQNGHQKRTARFLERLTNAELQTITTSGIDALGYDSGWVSALRFSFIGDIPTNWGEQYPVIFAFDAITARYGTLEISDTANTAGYVQAGRLFVGGGFQPEHNAEYGRQRGRTDLSSSVKSISGKKYSTARRRPRTVDMRFPVLTVAEGNHLDEMTESVGTTEEVFYIPDPADLALSQRQGFLAYLRELGALEDSFYNNVATPYRLEEKL